MSKESLAHLIAELEEATDEQTRFVDLSLILRNKATTQPVLWAGGKWDRLEQDWVGEADRTQIVDLQESQLEFSVWFAQWLSDYREGRPRKTSAVMLGGMRRGGKTHVSVAACLAVAIDIPNSIVWLVSKTYPEAKELLTAVKAMLPRGFYVFRGQPSIEFRFPNGSVVSVISADDPEAVKRGRVDVVLMNEPQKMDVTAALHALGGTIDKGGLMIAAANPPTRAVGSWVLQWKELCEQRKLPGALFFEVDAKKNEAIEHSAKGVVRDIAVALDPRLALADQEGSWLPIGDVAYINVKPGRHYRSVNDFSNDVTREVTRRITGIEYDYIAGIDFQGTPHNVAVVFKVFAGDRPDVPKFVAVDEVAIKGHEDALIDEIEGKGYTPENLLCIGDASGTWQDAKHNKGRRSFSIFRARGWHIEPPRKKQSAQGRFPGNPPVQDRLGLVNTLFSADRLYVDPETCPRLEVAFRKCELRHGKPFGRYAHVTDAAGYVLWWLEPAKSSGRGVVERTTASGEIDAWSVTSGRSIYKWA